MPVYEYTAINDRGKTIKGTLDAESSRVARQRLRSQGVYATDIREGLENARNRSKDIKRYFTSDRVSVRDLALATRQLSTLIGAGIPVVEALSALTDQTASVALKQVITDIRERVQEGSSLAKALGAFPKAFPKLYINMVAAGEASGTLHMVLENLADYLEAQLELRRKVSSALFYPVLMMGFCTLVVTALLTFVVPTVVQIFIKQGALLPLPTRIMLGISHLLTGYWYLIIALIVFAIYASISYYRQEKGRRAIDNLLLRLPIYGTLSLKITSARICRTLGTLLSNGVGVLESLEIVRNIVSNVHLAEALQNAKEGVREGKSLAKELDRSHYFPPMMIHMIGIGESSGKLESMLVKAGKSYENEVNALLAGLTSLIEPIMMIVLGGIVFSIVISILLPMVDLINIIQK